MDTNQRTNKLSFKHPPASGTYADADSRYSKKSRLFRLFDHFASTVTRWAGSPGLFIVALVSVLVWAIMGPIFGYSNTWQLVINTGTTIITFLMVFLIQQSQNKDSLAIHLKLNELIASQRNASNQIVGAEDMDEQDLRKLAKKYEDLANANCKRAERDGKSEKDQ